MRPKILVTGGEGRFAKVLKKNNKKLVLVFKTKKELDILNINSINRCIKKEKQKIIFSF